MRYSRKKYVFCIGVVLILLVLGVAVVLYGMKKRQEAVSSVVYEESTEEDPNLITWQGKQYRYNEHLSNYLFIGVDEYELQDAETGKLKAGQSDALFLVSYDRVTKDMTIISIPRDTMTDIEVFLADGSSAGMSRDHISLSYSFGDGKHESCQLTRDAVSNLFYGLSINGYCAMSMSGLAVIPETIGSFEVVVPNDSLTGKYPEFTEGNSITVTGENAEDFVRYRDIETSQSALERLERQQAFLEAALEKMEGQFEQDAGIVTELYEALTPYLVTSMGNDLFVELMESAYSGKKIVSWTVPGEGVTGKQYDEYHVDDELLYEKIMETFYIGGEQ